MLRRLTLLLIALACTVTWAQDVPAQLNVDVRLSIVESRLGRLELDVAGLTGIPVQLSRVEEKINALTEKASGNSSVLQTVGLGIIMSVITGVVSYAQGKRAKA